MIALFDEPRENGDPSGFDRKPSTRNAYYCRRQQQFLLLRNHIINWVPAFSERVEQATVCDFYQSMVRIAREFVTWDHEQLEGSEGNNERRRSGHN